MKILLTGGQGFLGRRVLDFLLEKGYRVRAAVRRPAPELEALGVETIRADLRDPEAARRAAQGVEGVIHCAAKSGVWGPLDDFIQANTLATSHLLTAARQGGAGWFVHTSSPSVAHSGRPLAGVDETAPYAAAPCHAYPYSKMLAEKIALAADQPGFRTLALRPHLIWGPGDPHFLPRLTAKARAGRLWLLKSTALVDATYIDNAAQAHLLAAEKLAANPGQVGGRAYFIAQDEPLTAADMLLKLLAAAARPGENLAPRGFLPARLGLAAGSALEQVWKLLGLHGEPPLTRFVAEELTLPHWFDLSRAKQELGYHPAVSMAEGLRRLAASLYT
jgi:nucleoside-diphosphate-sugar epimerase